MQALLTRLASGPGRAAASPPFHRPPAARAGRARPPPTRRSPWHAPPRPGLTTPGCTLVSPGPVPRADFPPWSPTPPGPTAPPTLGQGLGSAQARGWVRGARARAGSAWAGGRAGEGRGQVRRASRGPARRAASARTRGGGRGEGIKGAGLPLSDPPLASPAPPTRLKGWTVEPPLWPGLFVRQSGNTLHTTSPPPFTLPLLSASGARGPSARACQGPRARPAPGSPSTPPTPRHPTSPRPCAPPLAPPAPRPPPPARALPGSCAVCTATCSGARRRRSRPAVPSRRLPGPPTCGWPAEPWVAAAHGCILRWVWAQFLGPRFQTSPSLLKLASPVVLLI